MSGGSTERSLASGASAPASLQIRNWPLRDEGVMPWCFALTIVLLSVMAGAVTRNWGMGTIVFVAVSIAAWRLWLPVRYELGSRGIIQSAAGLKRRIPWSAVARYEIRRDGILFLTDPEHHPLSLLRSLYVRCGPDRKDTVELVEFFLKNRGGGASSVLRGQ